MKIIDLQYYYIMNAEAEGEPVKGHQRVICFGNRYCSIGDQLYDSYKKIVNSDESFDQIMILNNNYQKYKSVIDYLLAKNDENELFYDIKDIHLEYYSCEQCGEASQRSGAGEAKAEEHQYTEVNITAKHEDVVIVGNSIIKKQETKKLSELLPLEGEVSFLKEIMAFIILAKYTQNSKNIGQLAIMNLEDITEKLLENIDLRNLINQDIVDMIINNWRKRSYDNQNEGKYNHSNKFMIIRDDYMISDAEGDANNNKQEVKTSVQYSWLKNNAFVSFLNEDDIDMLIEQSRELQCDWINYLNIIDKLTTKQKEDIINIFISKKLRLQLIDMNTMSWHISFTNMVKKHEYEFIKKIIRSVPISEINQFIEKVLCYIRDVVNNMILLTESQNDKETRSKYFAMLLTILPIPEYLNNDKIDFICEQIIDEKLLFIGHLFEENIKFIHNKRLLEKYLPKIFEQVCHNLEKNGSIGILSTENFVEKLSLEQINQIYEKVIPYQPYKITKTIFYKLDKPKQDEVLKSFSQLPCQPFNTHHMFIHDLPEIKIRQIIQWHISHINKKEYEYSALLDHIAWETSYSGANVNANDNRVNSNIINLLFELGYLDLDYLLNINLENYYNQNGNLSKGVRYQITLDNVAKLYSQNLEILVKQIINKYEEWMHNSHPNNHLDINTLLWLMFFLYHPNIVIKYNDKTIKNTMILMIIAYKAGATPAFQTISGESEDLLGQGIQNMELLYELSYYEKHPDLLVKKVKEVLNKPENQNDKKYILRELATHQAEKLQDFLLKIVDKH